MADQPKNEPKKPVPQPGSLPKLPQTIFNLERKGGQGEDTQRGRPRK